MPGDHSDTASSRASCPVNHNASAAVAPHSRPECPVDHTQQQQAPSFAQSLLGSSKKADAPKCPVDHADGETSAAINPLNMMPQLTQDMHTGQTVPLSTEREFSTIPRSNTDDEAVWEYPSPQQFYNALARKNMAAPEEYVDVMVDIHNFLNEGAWNEVLKWEARHKSECLVPRLARLQGRPRDLSPMARISSWIHGVRPFDRHDWYVDR
ncbi:holocytochrome c synthase, partial [Coemansia sp. S85]